MMPARKITNTGTRKNIGKFASDKTSAVIPYESHLERDYIYFLEIDPDVISYTGQPFKLNYYLNGKLLRYTPDFFVERRTKKQVVEVKPSDKAQSEKYLALFNKVAPICREHDWEFLVVTNEMIRVEPRLSNIKILYKYSRVEYSLQHLIICKNHLQGREPITILQAEQSLRSQGISRQIIFRLVYSGFLQTDLMKPVGSSSLIQMTHKMHRYLI
jgi:TnsA endonuclease N terminal